MCTGAKPLTSLKGFPFLNLKVQKRYLFFASHDIASKREKGRHFLLTFSFRKVQKKKNEIVGNIDVV